MRWIWVIVLILMMGWATMPQPSKASHQFLFEKEAPNINARDLLGLSGSSPNDPEFIYQDYLTVIGAPAMWARGITGMSAMRPITVAVIDTGAALTHADLAGNLVPGFDFVNSISTTTQDQSADSHGSMVIGVIGGRINNGIGIAGLVGGDALSGTLGLRIMPLRVATDTIVGVGCETSAAAIDYARMHGATIINMSYGSDEFCQQELDAIQRAYDSGVALVAGAGNGGNSGLFYPAAYGAGSNEHLVIAVAGVYADGTKADESNYGTWVDISAPFRLIRSTTKSNGYDSRSGTSFSAPFVSGLLGLLMSNFGWSRDQAIAILFASADHLDDINLSYRGLLGAGRLNVDRASRFRLQAFLPVISG